MYVLRLADDVLLTGVIPDAADAWLALVRKYVNPRLCTVTDAGARFASYVLLDEAFERIDAALQAAPALLHTDTGDAAVLAHARLSVPGSAHASLLVVTSDTSDTVVDRLRDAGVTVATRAEWDVARIEAGLPQFGIDMDENTIPQEANLDTLGAISFTKGCYTGQEIVARIHFRGHVNRHLRGLRASSPLTRGDVITDATGKQVGDVRSTALSPRLGPIAIAMVRREIPVGSEVTLERGTATVHALPFEAT
jgi:folate-binding protein YgfZ